MEGLQRGLTYGISCLGTLVLLGGFTTLVIENKISPTKSTPFKLIPDVLKAMGMKKDEKLIDMGSGDGTFLIEAVREYKVKATGFDISPVHVFINKFKKTMLFLFKGENVKMNIVAENFLTLDVKSLLEFDTIYLNQPTTILKYFEPKAKELAEKGVRIFTFKNSFTTLKPRKVHEITDKINLFEY